MWKNPEMWLCEQSVNIIHSGYVEINQNSLISRLCEGGIKTEPYRFLLKNTICIMLNTMHMWQEMLAIEYFQIILLST